MQENDIINSEPKGFKILNPWFSIWLQPRKTMRQILDGTNHGHILELAALGGVADAFGRAGERYIAADTGLFMILLLAVIGGLIGGIIGLYIWSALVKWTGKWIGGKATYDELMAANAWSNIPVIWTLILWFIGILIFGKGVFTNQGVMSYGSLTLNGISWIFNSIIFIVGIWSIVTNIKCIAEAQGFSSWMAVANYLLSVLIIMVPFAILMIIAAAAFM